MRLMPPVYRFDYELTQLKLDEIPQDKVHKIFKDGRHTGVLVEHLYEYLFANIERAESERSPYDFLLRHDGKALKYQSKVGHYRTSGSSIDLSRSRMKGIGRRYDKDACVSDVLDLDGFVITDINQMPKLKVWTIPVDRLVPYVGEKSFKVKFGILDSLTRY